MPRDGLDNRMNRHRLLQTMSALPFIGSLFSAAASGARAPVSRVRPGDPNWPSDKAWEELGRGLEGRLIKVSSPLAACVGAPSSDACAYLAKEIKNPYYLGDEVGLTQTLGWVGAWTSRPSVYAVAAKSTADVVAAVNFARTHNLRLVIKGGGHSYQGTSNAADSLLIWTRPMSAIVLHDAFVGSGCEGQAQAQPAVSVEAGAIWGRVYQEVMVKAGRYVQGGGCLTVGVGGFVNGGGFGSLSKAFGTAAANLIEAEVVTADGDVKLANACLNPDLFWAIKGGGSGFGVVTRMALRTHELPEVIGAVIATIDASSDEAYRRLVAKAFSYLRRRSSTRKWGEQFQLVSEAGVCGSRWSFKASAGMRRRPPGVRSSIGSPHRRRTSTSFRRLEFRLRRAAGSGTPRHSGRFPGSSFPTIARARPRATSFGAGISTRPVRSSTPINRCGCRRLSLTSTSARASSRR